MDVVSVAATLIGIIDVVGRATVSVYQYASAVKGAQASCDKLLQELFAISGTLANARFVLADLQEDTENGRSAKLAMQLGGAGGPLDSCAATLHKLLSWLSRDGRGEMRLKRRMLWPLKEEKEILEFIKGLERVKTHLILALSLSSSEKLMDIADAAEDIKVEQQRVREEKTQQERRKHLDELVVWLSPLEVDVKHESSARLRQPGTAEWIMENDMFRTWRSSSASFLWLNGIPGSGKTILMSAVVDEIKSTSTEDEPFAYYYCDFSDSKSVAPVTLLRTLLCELLMAVDPGKPYEELRDNMQSRKSPPTDVSDLQTLIIRTIGSRKATIAIDALDECTDRHSLLRYLSELISRANIRLLVASRREQDIADAFVRFPTISLGMEGQNMQRDMQRYIAEALQSKPRLSRLPAELKAELGALMLQKADGMFRWIQCHLDFLSTRKTRQGFLDALRTLPRGLNPTYERILMAIENEGEEAVGIVKRTLLWLVVATRPLKLTEVMEAIMVERHRAGLNRDIGVLDERDILESCGSLVEYDPSAGIVTLSHYSVQEFLLSGYLQDSPLSQYHLSLVGAHRDVAFLMLTYLMFDEFRTGPLKTSEDLIERFRSHSLLMYATRNLFHHVLQVEEEDDELLDCIDAFLTDVSCCSRYRSYRQHLDFLGSEFNFSHHCHPENILWPDITPLLSPFAFDGRRHWAMLGLFHRHPELLDTEASGVGTPLMLAAWQDKAGMADMLIDLGADVDKPTRIHHVSLGKPYSALWFAIELGRDRIFSRLLARGASLYLRDGPMGDSLIFCASYNGRAAMITEMIHRGVDISAKARDGSTALHYAVQAGSLDTVRTLVEAGLNVRVLNHAGICPLQVAFDLRSSHIIQYLFDHGASIDDFSDLSPGQLTWATSEPWFPVAVEAMNRAAIAPNVPATCDDIYRTRDLLLRALRVPITVVREILNLAEYWVCTSVARDDHIMVVDRTPEKPYVSVTVQGGSPSPLRKIVFRTTSHDQGWSDIIDAHGSYRWSYTWFEAGAFPRPSSGNTDVSKAEISRRAIQYNVHASFESHTHTNVWRYRDRIPELQEWMRSFTPGDVLLVIPKASFPGWTNYVESVRVEVYCAWV